MAATLILRGHPGSTGLRDGPVLRPASPPPTGRGCAAISFDWPTCPVTFDEPTCSVTIDWPSCDVDFDPC